MLKVKNNVPGDGVGDAVGEFVIFAPGGAGFGALMGALDGL